jgi:hypothetical protein
MRGPVLDKIVTGGGFDPDFAVGVRPRTHTLPAAVGRVPMPELVAPGTAAGVRTDYG